MPFTYVFSATTLFAAVRVIREATQKLDQGYALLEAACRNANAAQLPSIMRAAQGRFITPVKTETITVKTEEGEERPSTSAAPGQFDPALMPVKVEPGVTYEPITVKLPEGGYQYKCPLCPRDVFTKSKNGMRGHIGEFHTGEVLLCEMCEFSSYNPDSLSKHVRLTHTPRK